MLGQIGHLHRPWKEDAFQDAPLIRCSMLISHCMKKINSSGDNSILKISLSMSSWSYLLQNHLENIKFIFFRILCEIVKLLCFPLSLLCSVGGSYNAQLCHYVPAPSWGTLLSNYLEFLYIRYLSLLPTCLSPHFYVFLHICSWMFLLHFHWYSITTCQILFHIRAQYGNLKAT